MCVGEDLRTLPSVLSAGKCHLCAHYLCLHFASVLMRAQVCQDLLTTNV